VAKVGSKPENDLRTYKKKRAVDVVKKLQADYEIVRIIEPNEVDYDKKFNENRINVLVGDDLNVIRVFRG
jgi:enolase